MSVRRAAVVVALWAAVAGRAAAQAWNPDLTSTRYRNPILFADYSDPDVVRVGEDFFMTASSFSSVPALPILHSRDLVHWTIVNHAIRRLPPAFDLPRHGDGVWAPSLRFHDGTYYIYYGDPDRGIFMVKTHDPRGKWDAPVLVHEARGWIDPCPLWDDDGNAYLVHAFAGSRAGIKSILHVNRMSADGTRLLDEGTLVFDGHASHPTIEGPKFYKRDGWYYIFAPAGGVPAGWQTVLRSRSPLGPYEDRIVLAQGRSEVNGPHQGAWVALRNGEHWFLHFQDRGAYGRLVHLQPMRWRDDGWPVIGSDPDGDGTGEPVTSHVIPAVSRRARTVPQTSDEFGAAELGLQWQWEANDQPGWYSLVTRRGWLRLRAQHLPSDSSNLWSAPNALMQKFPAPVFSATTRLVLGNGEQTAGLAVLGMDYAYIALRRTPAGVQVVQARATDAAKGSREVESSAIAIGNAPVWLRVQVAEGARCRFSYSTDGAGWVTVGDAFQARAGRWVGAKVGLFALRPRTPSTPPVAPHADFDFFRIRP